jgi:hypothetical protein
MRHTPSVLSGQLAEERRAREQAESRAVELERMFRLREAEFEQTLADKEQSVKLAEKRARRSSLLRKEVLSKAKDQVESREMELVQYQRQLGEKQTRDEEEKIAQLAQAERARDDAIARMTSLEHRLQELKSSAAATGNMEEMHAAEVSRAVAEAAKRAEDQATRRATLQIDELKATIERERARIERVEKQKNEARATAEGMRRASIQSKGLSDLQLEEARREQHQAVWQVQQAEAAREQTERQGKKLMAEASERSRQEEGARLEAEERARELRARLEQELARTAAMEEAVEAREDAVQEARREALFTQSRAREEIEQASLRGEMAEESAATAAEYARRESVAHIQRVEVAMRHVEAEAEARVEQETAARVEAEERASRLAEEADRYLVVLEQKDGQIEQAESARRQSIAQVQRLEDVRLEVEVQQHELALQTKMAQQHAEHAHHEAQEAQAQRHEEMIQQRLHQAENDQKQAAQGGVPHQPRHQPQQTDGDLSMGTALSAAYGLVDQQALCRAYEEQLREQKRSLEAQVAEAAVREEARAEQERQSREDADAARMQAERKLIVLQAEMRVKDALLQQRQRRGGGGSSDKRQHKGRYTGGGDDYDYEDYGSVNGYEQEEEEAVKDRRRDGNGQEDYAGGENAASDSAHSPSAHSLGIDVLEQEYRQKLGSFHTRGDRGGGDRGGSIERGTHKPRSQRGKRLAPETGVGPSTMPIRRGTSPKHRPEREYDQLSDTSSGGMEPQRSHLRHQRNGQRNGNEDANGHMNGHVNGHAGQRHYYTQHLVEEGWGEDAVVRAPGISDIFRAPSGANTRAAGDMHARAGAATLGAGGGAMGPRSVASDVIERLAASIAVGRDRAQMGNAQMGNVQMGNAQPAHNPQTRSYAAPYTQGYDTGGSPAVGIEGKGAVDLNSFTTRSHGVGMNNTWGGRSYSSPVAQQPTPATTPLSAYQPGVGAGSAGGSPAVGNSSNGERLEQLERKLRAFITTSTSAPTGPSTALRSAALHVQSTAHTFSPTGSLSTPPMSAHVSPEQRQHPHSHSHSHLGVSQPSLDHSSFGSTRISMNDSVVQSTHNSLLNDPGGHPTSSNSRFDQPVTAFDNAPDIAVEDRVSAHLQRLSTERTQDGGAGASEVMNAQLGMGLPQGRGPERDEGFKTQFAADGTGVQGDNPGMYEAQAQQQAQPLEHAGHGGAVDAQSAEVVGIGEERLQLALSSAQLALSSRDDAKLFVWAERGWRLWKRMQEEHGAKQANRSGGNDGLAHALLRSEMQRVLDAAVRRMQEHRDPRWAEWAEWQWELLG